jgi:hypothetical protein
MFITMIYIFKIFLYLIEMCIFSQFTLVGGIRTHDT